MEEGEPLSSAAARELEEETSVKPSDVILEQASFTVSPFISISSIVESVTNRFSVMSKSYW